MIPLRIEGFTHVLAAPPGAEGVPNMHVIITKEGFRVSRWELTPKELDNIIAGGCIELWLCGCQPIMAITTRPPPHDEGDR